MSFLTIPPYHWSIRDHEKLLNWLLVGCELHNGHYTNYTNYELHCIDSCLVKYSGKAMDNVHGYLQLFFLALQASLNILCKFGELEMQKCFCFVISTNCHGIMMQRGKNLVWEREWAQNYSLYNHFIASINIYNCTKNVYRMTGKT